MIVVVGGIKGGTGKTTLAINLVVMRAAIGRNVLLIDADEQKSASTFMDHRHGLGVKTEWTTIQLAGEKVHLELNKLAPNYDDVIVDVGGRDTRSQRSALLCADVYVVPFNPASFDIWTINQVRNLINDIQSYNFTLKPIVVVNRADHQGQDNSEAIEILKEHEEFICAPFTIGNRKIFRSAASDGVGVHEAGKVDKSARGELKQLYEMVFTIEKET